MHNFPNTEENILWLDSRSCHPMTVTKVLRLFFVHSESWCVGLLVCSRQKERGKGTYLYSSHKTSISLRRENLSLFSYFIILLLILLLFFAICFSAFAIYLKIVINQSISIVYLWKINPTSNNITWINDPLSILVLCHKTNKTIYLINEWEYPTYCIVLGRMVA